MTTTTIRRAYKFAMAPEHLIFDRRLSDRAVRLFLILDRRAAGRTETFPSRAMLAEDLDCSRESVDRAVRELCATGWLAKERADRGDVNSYVLLEAPVHKGVVTPDDTSDRRRQGRQVSSPVATGVVVGDAQEGDCETRDKNPPAPSEQAPPPEPEPAPTPKRRGARLPGDWTPNTAETEFAADLGFSAAEIVAIGEVFRDHWVAQPGQRGVKVDWTATWRNWVRRDLERRKGKDRKVDNRHIDKGDDATSAERRAAWGETA